MIHDNGAGGTLQQTSETYLGSSRRARYSGRETDKLHEWRLTGKRQTENERVVLTT
ncbi:hypothetical protein KBC03_04105 [Patescibacteria group bacterium]|nr:hypothetical protein [Patescibacteria group bacterium]